MDKEWLIDELDEVIYLSDVEDYKLLYMNEAGEKIANMSKTDYLGKRCYEVFQGRSEPCPFCTNAMLKKDEFYIWEYTNPFLKSHFILKDKLIKYNGKLVRMEVAVDITKQENVSRELIDKLEIENTLVKCIGSLISIENLDTAINLVLETIGQFYQSDRTYIIELEHEKKSGKTTYEWCKNGIQPQSSFLKAIHYLVDDFSSEKPIIINDIEKIKKTNQQAYEFLNMCGIDSICAVPFSVENKLTGYIGIDNPTIHKQDSSLLDSLSYFIINEIIKRRILLKLESISYSDALSGLLNRNSYVEYITHVNEEELASMGVIVADINGLKNLNQNFGHDFGDKAVKEIANILLKYFNEKSVFRLNGDEFLVLCENIEYNLFYEKVHLVKEAIDKMSYSSASIGYVWEDLDISIQSLIHHADELMFIDKRKYYKDFGKTRRNHWPSMTKSILELIDNRSFEMYLQPKADIQTGEIVGAEALVRLNHKEYGLVVPNKFIPLFEKEKVIQYVDFFIFEEVCRTLKKWISMGRKLIPISLNFSRITMLEKELAQMLISIYEKYNIPKEFIEIEITETIGEMEKETIAKIGEDIKKLGFSISLDDFGAKYTNMSMLTVMKFNVLKLDRSLVNNLVYNQNNQIVVRHVIEMCHEMNVISVAEGVETKEQLSLLKELSCDIAQGYLFNKPIPLHEFEEKYKSVGLM